MAEVQRLAIVHEKSDDPAAPTVFKITRGASDESAPESGTASNSAKDSKKAEAKKAEKGKESEEADKQKQEDGKGAEKQNEGVEEKQ